MISMQSRNCVGTTCAWCVVPSLRQEAKDTEDDIDMVVVSSVLEINQDQSVNSSCLAQAVADEGVLK